MKDEEKIEIIDVLNGYIVKNYYWEDTNEDGKKIIGCDTEVIEEEELKEGIQKLLYKIASLCGVNYDKWEKDNLNIQFNRKGRKV